MLNQVLAVLLASLLPYALADDIENDQFPHRVCRALSLSGGGAKGAYEVGALWQMARMLSEGEMEYDVLSGISVGSLNSLGFSFFKKGDELAATDFLKNLWYNMTNDKVWKHWDDVNRFQALYDKRGVLDNSPLKATLQNITDQFGGRVHRKLLTGAIDVETGEEIAQDFEELHPEEYVEAVLSSAAVPVVFPFQDFRGRKLADSMTCGWNVNVVSAVQKCLQEVRHLSQIELDVIIMYPNRLESWNETSDTIYNYLRHHSIKGYYSLMSDLREFIRAFPEVKLRYVVQASETPLPAYELLSFTEANIDKAIKLGMKDAEAAVKKGPGQFI